MNEVRLLEEKFGGWWCGVKFGDDADGRSRRADRPMRFCEAIAASRKGPVVLTPELLNCPGGSRSLGWNHEDESIAQAMAEKAGMDIGIARRVIRNTPTLNGGIGQVTIGTYESPDVVISYAQPEAAMKLLRAWQRRHGSPLLTQASGFMSVCGAVAVKAYLTGKICISFGCPDAREHGDIGRDRLVVGLPMQEVRGLAQRLSAAATKTVPTAPSVGAAKMIIAAGAF